MIEDAVHLAEGSCGFMDVLGSSGAESIKGYNDYFRVVSSSEFQVAPEACPGGFFSFLVYAAGPTACDGGDCATWFVRVVEWSLAR